MNNSKRNSMCKQKAKGNGVCRHCGFIGSTTMLIREHGSNCKFNPKNKEQMTNQETLEDAAVKYATNHGMMAYVFPEKRESFIDGAKWQSERMYSEEEVRLMLSESFKASQEGYDITSDSIIEQFKKK